MITLEPLQIVASIAVGFVFGVLFVLKVHPSLRPSPMEDIGRADGPLDAPMWQYFETANGNLARKNPAGGPNQMFGSGVWMNSPFEFDCLPISEWLARRDWPEAFTN